MNDYAGIAGRPGHRCGQCRFATNTHHILFCCVATPKPGREMLETRTLPELFCPSWEPVDRVKEGCSLVVAALPIFERRGLFNDIGETIMVTKVDRYVSVHVKVATVGAPIGVLDTSLADAYVAHALDCPCREKQQ